ncbi:4Fe-4S binding protein [Polaromonas sp.]|uniref:4Fe-4S binding protein n=1 Tax=Polaromonas sp. TaxID=1869339 RepID=UPI0018154B44|nr:4Fe-4S binding protein [Polaromonas sp.]NMM04926.1 4Fe-4S binding protein [Polaromonas sp.]
MRSIPVALVRDEVQAPMQTGVLARVGMAMRRHQRFILGLQWLVVVFYFSLLIYPVFMPLPAEDAHIVDNLRLFAQFMFWGVWWPFVMLGTMLLGRVWCGVFCPEGMLTELASRHGLGRAIPRWLRWSGWPFVTFVCTTVYGQLVSVYEYPQAALLVLGGSTLAAVAVGLVYGRGTRVWCRYLCPANGVFGLLAKIAPLHFRVNEAVWKQNQQRAPAVNCAPLIDIRHMKSASACHACGRCSGEHGAVELGLCSPAREILATNRREVRTDEAVTLIFGVIGIATAAFIWSSSSRFVQMKTALADWLMERDWLALLQDNAPWWLLTNYPAAHDVFTWLDGLCILAFILCGGGALGLAVWAGVWLAARVLHDPALSWQKLSLALVPMAGVGVFLGLSMLTLGHLKAEGITLAWVPALRGVLLTLAAGFSAYLMLRMCLVRWTRRAVAGLLVALAPLGLIVRVWLWVLFAL